MLSWWRWAPRGTIAQTIRNKKTEGCWPPSARSIPTRLVCRSVRRRPTGAESSLTPYLQSPMSRGLTDLIHMWRCGGDDNWRWPGAVSNQDRQASRRRVGQHEIAIASRRRRPRHFDELEVMYPDEWRCCASAGRGSRCNSRCKRPGPAMEGRALKMDFHYHKWFPPEPNVGSYDDAALRVMSAIRWC